MAKKKLSVQDEWSVMKDALMEKGFELEHLDRFMKRYVKAWIQEHIGLVSEWRLDSNHDFDNLGGFGISRFYEGVATVTFRGRPNKDTHEILTFLSDPSE